MELDGSQTPTDQCTTPMCDRELGCVAAPTVNAACDDADPCTLNDRCDEAGICVGDTLDCAAQAGPCQTGTCDPNACVFVDVADGTPCQDGSVCTDGDVCSDGVCEGSVIDCGADQCNRATCDPVSGCALQPLVGALCDDGDDCTGPDVCDASGACVGATIANPPMSCP